VRRGAYHFFTLCQPGARQADHVLAVVPLDPSALAPAVDLELAGNCARRPEVSAVRAELGAFLAAVERRTGRPTVLYLGRDFLDRYAAALPARHPRWYRRLYRRPSTEPWAIWQATARARIPGVAGEVDLDVARGPQP